MLIATRCPGPPVDGFDAVLSRLLPRIASALSKILQNGSKLVVESRRRTGDRMREIQAHRLAIEKSDDAAGLAHNQGTRGNIPNLRAKSPKRVKATGGDIAEVESRRSGSPHGLGIQHRGDELPNFR